ncbi:MAG TPA: YopX family protein [Chitinophagales bacterium]|nr:YopX family protein [Chitinophagales bacterium]
MRDIKFRGKRVDNGEFVYGYYVESKARHEGWEETGYWFSIYVDISDFEEPDHYQVIPETVGQYTGLPDMISTDIFEHDYMDSEEGLLEVFFIDGRFILMYADTGTYRCELNEANKILSVCGNKFSNPELLTQ